MAPTPKIPYMLADRLGGDLPPQRAFSWNRDLWFPVVHDVPDAQEVVRMLPDRLDREAVRQVVQANLTLDRVLGALLAVLIWGGPGGYYPTRTRSILTGIRERANMAAPVDSSIRGRLLEGSLRARKSDAVESFRFMNNEGRVKHLGGAFFTKWLSYSSMVSGVRGPEVIPILDGRVAKWIHKNAIDGQRIELSTDSTSDFRRYLEILDGWGSPFGRSRADVELAIFDLTRDRPAVE